MRRTPPSQRRMVVMIVPAQKRVACHRPEPDLHVVEATGNTIRCALSSGRTSLQSHVIITLQIMELITPTVAETTEVLERF